MTVFHPAVRKEGYVASATELLRRPGCIGRRGPSWVGCGGIEDCIEVMSNKCPLADEEAEREFFQHGYLDDLGGRNDLVSKISLRFSITEVKRNLSGMKEACLPESSREDCRCC